MSACANTKESIRDSLKVKPMHVALSLLCPYYSFKIQYIIKFLGSQHKISKDYPEMYDIIIISKYINWQLSYSKWIWSYEIYLNHVATVNYF